MAEHSVYVAFDHRGRGSGRPRLSSLVQRVDCVVVRTVYTVQAGACLSTSGVFKVHEACGFRRVGRWERLGLTTSWWRAVPLPAYLSP